MSTRNLLGMIGVIALLATFASPGAASTLDQEQLIYDAGLSARTLPGYTVWQSFDAGLTGTLTEIDMGFFNNMSGDGTLRIYSGAGTGGTILQTLDVTVVGITQPQVTWNYWTTVDVPVHTGHEYTFELTPNPLTLPDPYGVALGANNPYPRGVQGADYPGGSQVTTTFDAVFRTYVSNTTPSPEPSLLVLFGTGLGGLVLAALRRRKA